MRASSLEESGGYRMRFPNVHVAGASGAPGAGAPPCQGTIINTGGGMAMNAPGSQTMAGGGHLNPCGP